MLPLSDQHDISIDYVVDCSVVTPG